MTAQFQYVRDPTLKRCEPFASSRLRLARALRSMRQDNRKLAHLFWRRMRSATDEFAGQLAQSFFSDPPRR